MTTLTRQDGFARVSVCGLPITDCQLADVEGIIRRAVNEGDAVQLATVNLDFLRQSAEDERLAQLLRSCRHCFADGWPVCDLAARVGHPLANRVTGSDLTPLIFRWAVANGWRVACVGGSPEMAGRLLTTLPCSWRQALVGHWTPDYPAHIPFDQDLCAAIAAARADIVLVALGCPKQERWLSVNLADTGAAVGIGIGASLDFLAGMVPRAPKWVQQLKGEFLFRLLREPRRLGGRYLCDALFLLSVLYGGHITETSTDSGWDEQETRMLPALSPELSDA